MTFHSPRLWLLFRLSLFLPGLGALPAHAETRSITVNQETLGDIKIVAPKEEPSRFVIFISGAEGMNAARAIQAEALTAKGAAVALIDLPSLKTVFAKHSDDTCHYVFGDFEDLSRVAQRQLGMTDWQWPVLLGVGEGGTLAYLALAQAPSNTAGGGVSIGFSPTFATKRPICDGATVASEGKGTVTYDPMEDLPAPWTLILDAPASDAVKAFANNPELTAIQVVPGDDAARFDAAVAALFTMKPPTGHALADLPLTELPAQGQATTLLILFSGDGGWRDIDKQIGEYLSEHGVAVVGVDSLRYFWKRKEGKQIAADIERIADHYRDKWKLQSLALAGYSFGADIMPLAWPELEPNTQARTTLIALLGFEPTFDLEVSVSGWLGMASSTNIDVKRYLPALPKSKVMCFYGIEEKEENETACVFPELDGATRIERPGGHHFDGNYQLIADEILKRLKDADSRRTMD
ncbi:virulence factor family protein [Hyphomicrobium sp.]|uniref:virulence factor family protein n=1 Tax=Hyphomicrobium sp. TaxID=82 RepID=UPI002E2FFC79|nr:AcvB/VirJ family lysyl-phosphatidylglycerol hydrolase [Hyphomicrobium sp.]HEX2841062.1 AcvB/VirJ family lysyl-phosphatidylglycerol hydrolase [Hyphomicrobium sp.]